MTLAATSCNEREIVFEILGVSYERLGQFAANMLYFQRLLWLLADRPDFALLMGPEELLGQSVLLGGHGGVPGGANLYPQLYVQLYEAARSRDLDRLRAGQQQIMQISTGIYGLAPSGSSYLRGLKCALSILGICGDCPASSPDRRTARKPPT